MIHKFRVPNHIKSHHQSSLSLSHFCFHKILFNTSIGPAFEPQALKAWLANGENIFVCDTKGAIGEDSDEIFALPNVYCADVSAGRTQQAFGLLSKKVLDNIRDYLQL